VFAAVPIEMCRPWQWSTILSLGYCLDRRKVTRRALRTGVFYAWPMLYGWVYPQVRFPAHLRPCAGLGCTVISHAATASFPCATMCMYVSSSSSWCSWWC